MAASGGRILPPGGLGRRVGTATHSIIPLLCSNAADRTVSSPSAWNKLPPESFWDHFCCKHCISGGGRVPHRPGAFSCRFIVFSQLFHFYCVAKNLPRPGGSGSRANPLVGLDCAARRRCRLATGIWIALFNENPSARRVELPDYA